MQPSRKIKELTANRIVLKSPGGQIRAWFDASSEETVSLNLFGAKSSLSVCIDSDGNPKLNLLNKNNRVGVSIGLSDDLGHGITLSDKEGRPVCFITVPNDGVPRIELYKTTSSKRGKKFWGTPIPKGATNRPARKARNR